jgi:hypothetical protein
MQRTLTPVGQFGSYNTLYARDIHFVMNRIQSAPKFTILNQEI